MLARLRLLHRLRRQPDLLADVFGRRALQMRSLYLQPVPQLVQPPRQRRQPGKTRLDQHQLECRDALEHPLDHQAGDQGFLALRIGRVFLVVEGRPAASGRCVAAGAAQMQRDGKAVGSAGFEDRPVAAAAQRFQATRWDHDVGEAAVAGAEFDLLDRGFGVFEGDLDAGLQTRLGVAPNLRFPLVRGGGHRGAEFDVAFVGASAEQRHHQAVGYVEQVEQLLAHHLEVGAGMRAVLRIGVDTHAGERRHARIVRRVGERGARTAADLLAMLAPALGQELVQVGGGLGVGMHVAINDAQAGLVGGVGTAIRNGDVHRMAPLVTV